MMNHPFAPVPAGADATASSCGVCGSFPAKQTQLQSFVGAVLLFWVSTYKGMLCRNCAVAMCREMNARTLRAGWWMIFGVLLVAIGLLANVLRVRAFREVAWPVRYNTNPRPPLVIGPPLWTRPSVWALGLLGGFLSAVTLSCVVPAFFG